MDYTLQVRDNELKIITFHTFRVTGDIEPKWSPTSIDLVGQSTVIAKSQIELHSDKCTFFPYINESNQRDGSITTVELDGEMLAVKIENKPSKDFKFNFHKIANSDYTVYEQFTVFEAQLSDPFLKNLSSLSFAQ